MENYPLIISLTIFYLECWLSQLGKPEVQERVAFHDNFKIISVYFSYHGFVPPFSVMNPLLNLWRQLLVTTC